MLVSVAIPAYNQADYLREAICSVLNQTYKDIEIVVVDDGSTDHTQDVCTEFRKRVRYFYQENDGTLGGTSRTKAIRACRGDLIALLDHDDRWLPEKVAKQVQTLVDEPGMDAVFTGWRKIDRQGVQISPAYVEPPSGDIFHFLLRGYCYLLVSSVMIRRRVILEHVRALEMGPGDYSLFLSVARTHQIRFIQECLTEYRSYEGNSSSDQVRVSNEIVNLLDHIKKNNLLHLDCEDCREASELGLKTARENVARVYFHLYCTLAKSGKLFPALSYFSKMFETDPQFILDLRRLLASCKSGLYAVGKLM